MRITARRTIRRRAGFTLVEVLVAAGLCILIMTVLATAFQAGMDTLSQLKTLGELQQRLRAAEDRLRRDLQAPHVESPFGNRVSDLRADLWTPPPPITTGLNPQAALTGVRPLYHPPTKGFFRLIQEGEPSYRFPPQTGPVFSDSPSRLEGADPDGTPSTRATRHVLHMAVKLPGGRADQVFNVPIPTGTWYNLGLGADADPRLVDPTTLLSVAGQPVTNTAAVNLPTRWAEVVYFLDVPPGTTLTTTPATPSEPNGLPLYTLYRRVRGMPERDSAANWQLFQTAFPNVSCRPKGALPQNVNGPEGIANPANRLGGINGLRPGQAQPTTQLNPPLPAMLMNGTALDFVGPTVDAAGQPTGEDILLTNVVSFEAKLTWAPNAASAGYGLPVAGPTGQSQIAADPPGGVSANLAELMFDDLPVPRAVPPGMGGPIPQPLLALWGYTGTGTFGFQSPDGNPLFPRMVPLPAPPNAAYADTPTGLPGPRRRVFDTWHKVEPPLVVTNSGGRFVIPRPAYTPIETQSLQWDNATPPMPQNLASQVDQWGRWDERYVPINYGTRAAPSLLLVPNPNYVPLPIRPTAIQIKLRIWDPKNKATRQVTIVENL